MHKNTFSFISITEQFNALPPPFIFHSFQKSSKDSQITTRLSCRHAPCRMHRIVVLIFTATSLGLQATKRTFSLKKQPCPCATVKEDYVGKGEKIGCSILEPDKGGRILPRKIPKAHNRMLLFISWRHKLNSN